MTPLRRALELFEALCELPPDVLPREIERHCEGNAELRSAVEALLAGDASRDATWETPLANKLAEHGSATGPSGVL